MEEPREARKKVNMVARLFANGREDNVVCCDVSTGGCMLRMGHMVNTKTKVQLSFFAPKGKEGVLEQYEVVVATIRWCRPSKNENKLFFAGVQFNHDIKESHGILQILFPERFADNLSQQKLETSNNSLMGTYARCFVCEADKVALWLLRSRSMLTKPNLFRIPIYHKPMPNKDFVDYNLLQVNVCPNCQFASNETVHFHSTYNSNCGFDTTEFGRLWRANQPKRNELFKSFATDFEKETRTVDQAIISYTFAIQTHETLARLGDQVDQIRKIATFMVTRADILMEKGDQKAALMDLQRAAQLLDSVFGQLEEEHSFRASLMLGLIGIFFRDSKRISHHLGYLQTLERSDKYSEGQQSTKVLKGCTTLLLKAFQERENLSFDKLKSFHVDL